MIRASSLGTVLSPARFTRITPRYHPIWTRSSSPLPLSHADGEEFSTKLSDETTVLPSSMSSTGNPQLGSADGPVACHAQPPVGFQLPDPVPVRTHAPHYFVRQPVQGYPVGKSWRKLPLPIIHPKILKYGQPLLAGHGKAPFYDDIFEDLDLSLLFDAERSIREGIDRVAWRRNLLRVLGNTQSHQQAWKAYYTLVSVPFSIPHRHLNRLVRLLARQTTKTRIMFGRLLSVLTSIYQSGWNIEAYQWNALIDNAGKGLRRARPEDFKLAFEMFTDMVSAKPPGATSSGTDYNLDEEVTDNPLPDIITYTTLINHAAESRMKATIDQTTSLLTASGISPNRITHLVLLKYYSNTGKLDGVRASLAKMRQQDLPLGLDGLNACMWAFARHDRLDVSMKIYGILRHNTTPEVRTHVGPDDVHASRRALLEENIEIHPDMVPNELTYTSMVQVMAYHGNLDAALSAFVDMLSSQNVEIGAPMYRDDNGRLAPSPYSPTLPVFRALFLGYFRHGVVDAPPMSQLRGSRPWVLTSLKSLLDAFLALPEYIQPSTSTIYWALIAFDKTSGHDHELLRSVWTRIEDRFGGNWGASQHRLQRIREQLFDPGAREFGLKSSRTTPIDAV
ncbi:hypothetical protein C8R43DRAFT_300427 [Mycena crocata]|nr:hypothetical protein C8R43DRAFT_300427 [Mycena crocata]